METMQREATTMFLHKLVLEPQEDIPRPLLPQFVGNQQVGNQGQQGQGETFDDYWREYQAMGEDFQAAMSLQDYCNIKYRNRPREVNRGQQNDDLRRKVGKLTIPSFDGSSKSTARAWVQKLDTYFQLNTMTEDEAIKFATLHLDGEAHEWWYHGLVTLGHANITSYLDFTQKLMERFDRKDLEIHFRELAQLKQVGTPDAYITEFQKLVVTVTDISEQRLVMLFTKGLSEPLCGWVKAFKPETLQDAIIRTRDMEDVVPKTKTFSKPFIPQKNKDKKPFQKEGTGKEKMDEATRNELRRKKLCFNCKDPWEPGHRCMGKGKAHYIEVLSESEDEEEVEQAHDCEQDKSAEEQPQEEAKSGAIATLSSVPRFHTFRIRGVVQGQ
jgi:hypothetical protein